MFLSDFLLNFDFLDRFSKKSSNIKFYQNPFTGSLVVLRGRNGHEVANSRFSKCHESAQNSFIRDIWYVLCRGWLRTSEPEVKIPLGGGKCILEDNFKINHKEMRWFVEVICLAEDVDRWKSLFNTLRHFRIFIKRVRFFSIGKGPLILDKYSVVRN